MPITDLIDPKIFFIIVFLIPGYLGFNSFLIIINMSIKTSRWRVDTLSNINKFIWTVIWSSMSFYLAFYATYSMFSLNQFLLEIVPKLTISKMGIITAISFGIAESLAIILILVYSISTKGSKIITVIFNFIIGKYSYGRLNRYLSFCRFKKLWKELELTRLPIGGMHSLIYNELLKAFGTNQRVEVVLKSGEIIKGKFVNMVIDLSELTIKESNKKFTTIKLRDIQFVSVYNF